MDTATKKLSEYVSEKGINIKNMASAIGMSYAPLFDSLSLKGKRNLRASEFLSVCNFLNLNPMDFYEELDSNEQSNEKSSKENN